MINAETSLQEPKREESGEARTIRRTLNAVGLSPENVRGEILVIGPAAQLDLIEDAGGVRGGGYRFAHDSYRILRFAKRSR